MLTVFETLSLMILFAMYTVHVLSHAKDKEK
ncbi:putative holin-like toxin [Shouchella lonarensis]|nr:putative holin-like toxin [Shouchella lonarensis]